MLTKLPNLLNAKLLRLIWQIILVELMLNPTSVFTPGVTVHLVSRHLLILSANAPWWEWAHQSFLLL